MILPDICYLHHYNILTQTKLNTRIALVKQTLNWRALRQIIPLNFLNPEAEGWPHRAQCLKGKTRNRRYSLVHRISTNGTSGSPIRIPWVPSGDAPEVVACRWLQANQDGWSNLIHVAVLGPQERAVVVSIFSICGCGITIIYIDIPLQNADTYLPLRLQIYAHEQYNVIVYFLDLLAPICVIRRKLREIQHV